jgi:uncharacterized OB-fold protein
MRFRILKFRPPEQAGRPPEQAGRPQQAERPEQPAAPKPAMSQRAAPRPRPVLTHDTAFWWEAVQQGRLLIQRCSSCGALRHPPGPMCGACRSLDWDTIEASGRGVVFSFVVNHHPQLPAFDYPLVVALVELEEGTRLVSDLVDCPPDEVAIGMPVQIDFVAVDDELTLPLFRRA